MGQGRQPQPVKGRPGLPQDGPARYAVCSSPGRGWLRWPPDSLRAWVDGQDNVGHAGLGN